MKRISIIAGLWCVVFLMAACSKETREEIWAKEIVLDQSLLSMIPGQTLALTANLYPESATDKTVTWSSTNLAVATVSATGQVNALKVGTTEIVAESTASGLKAACIVSVVPISYDYTQATEDRKGVVPSSGNGTKTTPYLIACADNLKWLKEQADKFLTKGQYYKLTHDLNISVPTWQTIFQFEGHFDGGNHKITGTLCQAPDIWRPFGFFSTLYSGGTIRRLIMDAEVKASKADRVGAIAGDAIADTDEEIYSITDCTNNGSVTGAGTVGGIVGAIDYELEIRFVKQVDHTILSGCINKGRVTSTLGGSLGGIIGKFDIWPFYLEIFDRNIFRITGCRNEGEVTAFYSWRSGTGGIIGGIDVKGAHVVVSGCYNTPAAKVSRNDVIADKKEGSSPNNLGLILGRGEYVSSATIKITD